MRRSDLTELARTPVALICAGAKAILDLPKTLEVLETLGVPVVGWDCIEFPAFYGNESGILIEEVFESAEELALFLNGREALHMRQGVLVAVPVLSAVALPADVVQQAVAGARQAAQRAGVRGKALTPFLLKEIEARTFGVSVATNTALVEANAARASELACALVASRRHRNLPFTID